MGTWEHRAILEGNKGTRIPPPGRPSHFHGPKVSKNLEAAKIQAFADCCRYSTGERMGLFSSSAIFGYQSEIGEKYQHQYKWNSTFLFVPAVPSPHQHPKLNHGNEATRRKTIAHDQCYFENQNGGRRPVH